MISLIGTRGNYGQEIEASLEKKGIKVRYIERYEEKNVKKILENKVILLDCKDVKVLKARIASLQEWSRVSHDRSYFRDVYGCHVPIIDTSHRSLNECITLITSIINDEAFQKGERTPYHLEHDIENLSQETFEKLPLVCEGESKIIRSIKHPDYQLVVILLKDTVYSYTQNRLGRVDDTDRLRLICTKAFLKPIRAAGLIHTYWHVTSRFILSDLVEKPPPIEVIVKKQHVGTPIHRYYGMDTWSVRASHPTMAGIALGEKKDYPTLMVRFDWRNPLIHPTTNKRLPDEVLPETMADWFIDIKTARKTAEKCFKALSAFLAKRYITLQDICFMIAEDGQTLYGEISQDCGRYQSYAESLGKDVWRQGKSSTVMKEKYALLNHMIAQYPWQEHEAPWHCYHES